MEKIELPDEIALEETEARNLRAIWIKAFRGHLKAAQKRLKSEEIMPRVRKLPWPALAKYHAVADKILCGEREFLLALKLAPEQAVRGFSRSSLAFEAIFALDPFANAYEAMECMTPLPPKKSWPPLLKTLRLLLSLNEDAWPAYCPRFGQWPPLAVRMRSKEEFLEAYIPFGVAERERLKKLYPELRWSV